MTEQEFTSIAHQLRELAMLTTGYYHLSNEEAEDIAQDAMLKLWAIKKDVNSVEHAKGLCVKIVKHLAIDHFRKRKLTLVDESFPNQYKSENAMPDALMEEEENERWLMEKIRKLPSNQYQVVYLSQMEHKTNEEIAEILSITPASAATLLSRARKTLLQAIRQRNHN